MLKIFLGFWGVGFFLEEVFFIFEGVLGWGLVSFWVALFVCLFLGVFWGFLCFVSGWIFGVLGGWGFLFRFLGFFEDGFVWGFFGGGVFLEVLVFLAFFGRAGFLGDLCVCVFVFNLVFFCLFLCECCILKGLEFWGFFGGVGRVGVFFITCFVWGSRLFFCFFVCFGWLV